MDLVEIRQLYRSSGQFIGKTITVGGWVRSIRDSKTFGFIVLHDGTCFNTLRWYDKLDNLMKYPVEWAPQSL